MGVTNSGISLDKALELHRAGQLEQAARIYRHLHEKDISDADACYGLGTVLMQQGQSESALPLLHQAVQTAPHVPEFVFNYGCALQQLGRNVEAARKFIRATKLVASDATLLVNICSRLVALDQPNAAAAALLEGSERFPDTRRIWLALASVLTKIRDYKGAIAAFDAALRLAEANAEEQLAYADLLLESRQLDAAAAVIDRMLEQGTDDPRAYLLAARCHKIAGNYDDQRSMLKQVIDRSPWESVAWQMLQDSATPAELPKLASECRRRADDPRASPHNSAGLLYTSGRALHRLGEYDEAFATFVLANSRQRTDAESRGVYYDKKETEHLVQRIQKEFEAPDGAAAFQPAEADPIFIVGMPRSGTTLVERILGGLEDVATGGECTALETMAWQYYWALDHQAVKPFRSLRPSDWNEFIEQYWHLQSGQRGRLTDKMPSNFKHVGMISCMFPGAPIVYMRRDPRDVGLSMFTRRFSDGHPYATELGDLAHFYAMSEQLMTYWQSVYPGRIFEIEYEQLVAEPEKITRALAKYCALQWRPECLDFHERSEASYTFSELQVREPLNAKGIGRWRKYTDGLAPFTAACVAQGVQLRDN